MKNEAAEAAIAEIKSKFRAQWAQKALDTIAGGFAALKAERDEARERADELEGHQETIAADFEKDCWVAMRSLLKECHFDWRDVDVGDGLTADDAREYISTTISEIEKSETKYREKASASEAEVSALKAKVVELEGERDDPEERRERILKTVVPPDNGTVAEVFAAVLKCARAWVPEARIIGNVRAGDIARATTKALASEAECERLREALVESEETLRLVEHPAFPDPSHHAEVKALGNRIGFGALMSTASAGWREALAARGDPVGGEFVAGPCLGTVVGTIKVIRAALEGKAHD